MCQIWHILKEASHPRPQGGDAPFEAFCTKGHPARLGGLPALARGAKTRLDKGEELWYTILNDTE